MIESPDASTGTSGSWWARRNVARGATGNLRRTPKNKRAEIKELVQVRLLTRCLPVPSIVDVVWDQKSGILTLFSLGGKVIERFEEQFRKTFEGFSPVVIHPFARARMLLDGPLLESLEKSNQANSDAVTALIREMAQQPGAGSVAPATNQLT